VPFEIREGAHATWPWRPLHNGLCEVLHEVELEVAWCPRAQIARRLNGFGSLNSRLSSSNSGDGNGRSRFH